MEKRDYRKIVNSKQRRSAATTNAELFMNFYPLELPDKPSDLIEVALTDLERVERDDRYKIAMGEWHEPNGKCSVCLAGAVISRVAQPNEYWTPGLMNDFVFAEKLRAINYFRAGMVASALHTLNIPFPEGLTYDLPIPEYENDRDGFYTGLRAMVGLLREYNL
jgi:hypothetical protein